MSLKRKAAELAAGEAKKTKANSSITSFFGAPKAKAVEFDKAKWVESLTDEQKDLLKLEIHSLHESWLAHLKDEIVTKDFLDLKRFIKEELRMQKTIFPPLQDVYSW